MTSEFRADDAAPVIVERIGHVTVLTLNRPRTLNAMNAELATALGNCLPDLDQDL